MRASGIADAMPRSTDGDEEVPKEWLIDAAAQLAVTTFSETVSRQRPAQRGLNDVLDWIPCREVRLTTGPAASGA